MKHPRFFAILLIICSLLPTLLIPSCASDPVERRTQITQAANLALTVGEFTGRVSPKQAALIRKHGVLILDAAEGKQPELIQVSNAAVDIAVETGAITQDQADQLHALGTVPLSPPDPQPAFNPLLPPGPAITGP